MSLLIGDEPIITSDDFTTCVELDAGVHPIRWLVHKKAGVASPTLHHRFCGPIGSPDCEPKSGTVGDGTGFMQLLRPTFDGTPECEPGTCTELCPCDPGTNPCGETENPCTMLVCNYSNASEALEVPRAAGTSCNNNDVCDGIDERDGAGACVSRDAPQVDDHNPCTIDTCDPVAGVQHESLAEGTPCSLGCAGEGTCSASFSSRERPPRRFAVRSQLAPA